MASLPYPLCHVCATSEGSVIEIMLMVANKNQMNQLNQINPYSIKERIRIVLIMLMVATENQLNQINPYSEKIEYGLC